MPQVRFSPAAIRDLERLREFLQSRNPAAARRAGLAIIDAVKVLGQHPEIGRVVDGMDAEYREWPIDFGDSGYVALYRREDDIAVIIAIRHQREAGY